MEDEKGGGGGGTSGREDAPLTGSAPVTLWSPGCPPGEIDVAPWPLGPWRLPRAARRGGGDGSRGAAPLDECGATACSEATVVSSLVKRASRSGFQQSRSSICDVCACNCLRTVAESFFASWLDLTSSSMLVPVGSPSVWDTTLPPLDDLSQSVSGQAFQTTKRSVGSPQNGLDPLKVTSILTNLRFSEGHQHSCYGCNLSLLHPLGGMKHLSYIYVVCFLPPRGGYPHVSFVCGSICQN